MYVITHKTYRIFLEDRLPFSSGENATDLRLQMWPLKLPNSSPDFMSHNLAIWSPAAVT